MELGEISKKIKSLRLQKGMNQETLAQRAGLARSYISLIESGKKMAALSTLVLIADGLGVGVGEFFEDEENFQSPKIVVNRKINTRPTTEKTPFGYTYSPLSRGKRNKMFDPFFIRLQPKSKQQYDFVHKGEEFDYILQGSIKLTYGDEVITLEAGDSVYFDSSVAHRLEVIGNKVAYMISINAPGLQKT